MGSGHSENQEVSQEFLALSGAVSSSNAFAARSTQSEGSDEMILRKQLKNGKMGF